jgi:aerobic C4-dicarboxylate transport protein
VKIWIKLLVGSIVGIILGVALPAAGGSMDLMAYLSRLFVHVGRYVVFPLTFFGLVIGTYELKREKNLGAVYGRAALYLLGSSFLLILIGIGTLLAFSPERIPIIVEQESALRLPGIRETLLGLFPENLFQALVGSGSILLPVAFLAVLIGVNLTFDLHVTNPVVQLADSLSRIFYHVNSLLSELFGFAMVVIAAAFLMNVRQGELALFRQILIILAIDCAVVVFAVYPALMYLLGERENPYKWLYASIAAALVGFFSGDSYLSLTMLAKHGRENLGVPRRVGSAVYTVFAVFGRAGTALVASASFLLILKSYSSLEISFLQVLWTVGFTLFVSVALGSVPGMGAYVALASLCGLFGRGLQEGYLILKPIAPLLISFGALLDVLTSGFVAMLVARRVNAWKAIDSGDFV